MKLGIHFSKRSFSERWITFCEERGYAYKIVDCYRNDIIDQLRDCDALLWHHHHGNFADSLFAKSLLFSVEMAGKMVFPNFHTGWFFDDKVGQKYLLEALGLPTVPTSVFYTKRDALAWCKSVEFPKVFKLRGGAGSSNVRLVNNRRQAFSLVRKAFGSGFKQADSFHHVKDRIRKASLGNGSWLGVVKAMGRVFLPDYFTRMKAPDRGYIYFQDFISGNEFDIRVIVIGERAFAIKRMVRENDFRASGSGRVLFGKDDIDVSCVEMAFRANSKIGSQCIAFDFVFDSATNSPLIVEVSYGFSQSPYDGCEGYWDSELQWHPGAINPQGWIIEDIVKSLE